MPDHCLAIASSLAFAPLFVVPEGNLLLSLSLLLLVSSLVLKSSPRSAIQSIPRSISLRLRARLQPCHKATPNHAALAAEVPAQSRLSALLRNRYTALATLLLAIILLGAADPTARTNKLGHEMICTCGCTQILLECNHVGCPVSPVMINELQSQVAQSGPDNLILNWFAAKYGATVLAAPMRGGFDNVAWITPLAVFFFATVGVAFLVTVWKKRNPVPAPAGSTIDNTLRARIRRETEY